MNTLDVDPDAAAAAAADDDDYDNSDQCHIAAVTTSTSLAHTDKQDAVNSLVLAQLQSANAQ